MPYPMSQDSRISSFYDYWNGLRATGTLPAQDSIDPAHIAPLLPFVWLVRWNDQVDDFVYRLAGENVLDIVRQPVRHKRLGALYEPVFAETLRRRFHRLCSGPTAYYERGRVYRHIDRYGFGERLALPLADEEGRNRLVIGCTVYAATNWPPALTAPPSTPDPEIGVYTNLDGDPVEPVREAG